MSSSLTAAEKAIAKKDADARLLLRYAEQLEKCPAWTEYLKPKVFGSFDRAQENILAAAAKGQPASQEDITLFAALHPLVSEIRHTQQLALKRVGPTASLAET